MQFLLSRAVEHKTIDARKIKLGRETNRGIAVRTKSLLKKRPVDKLEFKRVSPQFVFLFFFFRASGEAQHRVYYSSVHPYNRPRIVENTFRLSLEVKG